MDNIDLISVFTNGNIDLAYDFMHNFMLTYPVETLPASSVYN